MSMIDTDAIMSVLETIPDPEMPVNIVDLGLIERLTIEPEDGGARVVIDVLPTFVGCPALDMIRGDIEAKVGHLAGVDGVVVNFIHDPPWSVDRISEAGRASLKQIGVGVPGRDAGMLQMGTPVPCPFCGATETRLESSFGPTRCRMIYYCTGCKNSFEQMKRV